MLGCKSIIDSLHLSLNPTTFQCPMSQVSSKTEDPAKTDKQEDETTHKPSNKEKLNYVGLYLTSLLTSLVLLTPPAGFGIIIWALVAYVQSANSNLPDCTARFVDNGFTGNSDFYGLGIRLGVYLQWWASLLANIFLPNEWYSMLGAYMVFSLALIVALLVLSFQHTCTFTAEIIIVLFMYWGGFSALTYSCSAVVKPMMGKEATGFGTGLNMALIAPMWTGIAFSTWFWLRLATAGEVDFTPTPGGTLYFLLARISAQNKPASRFVVFVCFFFGWVVVISGIGYMIGYSFGLVWGSTKLFYQRLVGANISTDASTGTSTARRTRTNTFRVRDDTNELTTSQK